MLLAGDREPEARLRLREASGLRTAAKQHQSSQFGKFYEFVFTKLKAWLESVPTFCGTSALLAEEIVEL